MFVLDVPLVFISKRRKCVQVSYWDAYDKIRKPGFHINISGGDVSQIYLGCYGDVADHKCVVSIKNTVPASTGTRLRCIGDVLKS